MFWIYREGIYRSSWRDLFGDSCCMLPRACIYLPCRDPQLSYTLPPRTRIYSQCRDEHLSNVWTCNNLCCATLAKDLVLAISETSSSADTLRTWIYLTCRDPHSSCAMTCSNLCSAPFAKDWKLSVEFTVCCRCRMYTSRRESHVSCAMPLRTWMYI